NGLDPRTGKVYWSQPFRVKAEMSIPTPRLAGDKLFVTCFYSGCMLLQLTGGGKPGAPGLWRSRGRGELPRDTDKLHAVMCTPVIEGDSIYGVCSYGQLRRLRLKDGKRMWQDLRATGCEKTGPQRWANAFLVAQGDRFFIPNER